MRLRFAALGVVLLASVAVACGDGDAGNAARGGTAAPTPRATDDGGGRSATATPPAQTPVRTFEAGNATPSSFEELRDGLVADLAAMRATIGAVPADVRQELLDRCRALAQYVDAEEVAALCGAIDDAVEENDPGRIDLVLDRLGELRAE